MNHFQRPSINRSAAPGHRRRAAWLVGAMAALATAAAGAVLPLKSIEECLESGTSLVRLPGVPGGSLSASECRGCPSVRLNFDARTRYYIGKEPVSYARLREQAANGDLRLDLFYDPKTRNLTRLRLVAVGKAK